MTVETVKPNKDRIHDLGYKKYVTVTLKVDELNDMSLNEEVVYRSQIMKKESNRLEIFNDGYREIKENCKTIGTVSIYGLNGKIQDKVEKMAKAVLRAL
jgi:hypothetical protein